MRLFVVFMSQLFSTICATISRGTAGVLTNGFSYHDHSPAGRHCSSVGAEARVGLHAGVDAGERELLDEIGGRLGKAHRPQDARRGHFRLRLDAELDAPHAARRVLDVIAGIGARGLERDELEGAVRRAAPAPRRRGRERDRARADRLAPATTRQCRASRPTVAVRAARMCTRRPQRRRRSTRNGVRNLIICSTRMMEVQELRPVGANG